MYGLDSAQQDKQKKIQAICSYIVIIVGAEVGCGHRTDQRKFHENNA